MPEVAAASAPHPGSIAVLCWRCNKRGHYSYDCPEKPFCKKCGMPDTAEEKCANCAYAQRMGLWTESSQRNSGNISTGQTWGGLSPFSFPPPPLRGKSSGAPPVTAILRNPQPNQPRRN